MMDAPIPEHGQQLGRRVEFVNREIGQKRAGRLHDEHGPGMARGEERQIRIRTDAHLRGEPHQEIS